MALTGLLSAVALTAWGGGDDAPATASLASVAVAGFPPVPTLIARRGASALRPEYTTAAHSLHQAFEDGADIIEPDLVATKDGMQVARHETYIATLSADGTLRESTTDMATRPEFAAFLTTKTIDGAVIRGWFTKH